MKALIISGDTYTSKEWNLNDILSNNNSKEKDINTLIQYEWDNTISRCGMSYLEIEQFNNSYNNFR
jgi:hypothetical protein